MKGLEETWQEAKMDFKGQTALVVGASRGFGRGVTESLVAKGMTVTAVARTREDLEDLARKTLARIIVADATDEQAIERILSGAKPNLLDCLLDRKSTRLNSSHLGISYAVFCLKKKKIHTYLYVEW